MTNYSQDDLKELLIAAQLASYELEAQVEGALTASGPEDCIDLLAVCGVLGEALSRFDQEFTGAEFDQRRDAEKVRIYKAIEEDESA